MAAQNLAHEESCQETMESIFNSFRQTLENVFLAAIKEKKVVANENSIDQDQETVEEKNKCTENARKRHLSTDEDNSKRKCNDVNRNQTDSNETNCISSQKDPHRNIEKNIKTVGKNTHMVSKLPDETVIHGELKYGCRFCPERFPSLIIVRGHVWTKHKKENELRKQGIYKATEALTSEKLDRKLNPKLKKRLPDATRQKSPNTDKGQARKVLFKHNELKFRCRFCPERFPSLISVRTHIWTKHKEENKLRKLGEHKSHIQFLKPQKEDGKLSSKPKDRLPNASTEKSIDEGKANGVSSKHKQNSFSCWFCTERFSSFITVKEHIQTNHIKENKLGKLGKHKSSIKDVKPQKEVGKLSSMPKERLPNASTKKNIDKGKASGVSSKHKKYSFRCRFCTERFPSLITVRGHIWTKHREENLQRKLGEYKTNNVLTSQTEDGIVRPKRKERSARCADPKQKLLYFCSTCKFASLSYDCLIQHCQDHIVNDEDPDHNLNRPKFKRYIKIFGQKYNVDLFTYRIGDLIIRHTKLFKQIHCDYKLLKSDNWPGNFETFTKPDINRINGASIYNFTRIIRFTSDREVTSAPFMLYQCMRCMTYVDPHSIKSHVQENSCHGNRNSFSCYDCERPFFNECAMYLHYKTHKVPDADKKYKTIFFNDDRDFYENTLLLKAAGIHVNYAASGKYTMPQKPCILASNVEHVKEKSCPQIINDARTIVIQGTQIEARNKTNQGKSDINDNAAKTKERVVSSNVVCNMTDKTVKSNASKDVTTNNTVKIKEGKVVVDDNAVKINVSKDATIDTTVKTNEGKRVIADNAVKINAIKDATIDNAVKINGDKDVTADKPVKIIIAKDFTTDNTVKITRGKDVITDNAVKKTVAEDVTTERAVKINMGEDVITDIAVKTTVGEDVTTDRSVKTDTGQDVITNNAVKTTMGEDVTIDKTVKIHVDKNVILDNVVKSNVGKAAITDNAMDTNVGKAVITDNAVKTIDGIIVKAAKTNGGKGNINDVDAKERVAVIYKCSCELCFHSLESLFKHLKNCPDETILQKDTCTCGLDFDETQYSSHNRMHYEGFTTFNVKRVTISDEKTINIKNMQHQFKDNTIKEIIKTDQDTHASDTRNEFTFGKTDQEKHSCHEKQNEEQSKAVPEFLISILKLISIGRLGSKRSEEMQKICDTVSIRAVQTKEVDLYDIITHSSMSPKVTQTAYRVSTEIAKRITADEIISNPQSDDNIIIPETQNEKVQQITEVLKDNLYIISSESQDPSRNLNRERDNTEDQLMVDTTMEVEIKETSVMERATEVNLEGESSEVEETDKDVITNHEDDNKTLDNEQQKTLGIHDEANEVTESDSEKNDLKTIAKPTDECEQRNDVDNKIQNVESEHHEENKMYTEDELLKDTEEFLYFDLSLLTDDEDA